MTRDRGSVLILVLLVIVLLEGLLLEFHHRSRVRAVTAENIAAADKALFGAQACMAVATRAIETSSRSSKVRDLFAGGKLRVGPGTCEIFVQNEAGRINVNALVDSDGDVQQRSVELLLSLIDHLNAMPGRADRIPYNVVASILDWIDEDDLVTQLSGVTGQSAGAEREYYLGLNPPYSCRNGRFDTVDELRLVRGVAAPIARSVEATGGTVDAPMQAVSALLEYVTVFGPGRIDVNAASPAILASLAKDMTPRLVDEIVAQRAVEPFTDVKQISNLSGMTKDLYEELQPLIGVDLSPEFYRITATGYFGEASRTVVAIVVRRDDSKELATVARWER